MNKEEIGAIWQKAMYSAIKSNEPSTRYEFANLILEAAAQVCEEKKSNWNYCAEAIRSMKT